MTKQTINIGTVANDGTGDPLRTSFDKINSNFDELFANGNNVAVVSSNAFNKANSANVLAYNTGIGANAYADIVGTSTNAFMSATVAGANTAVGAGANAFTSATVAGANTAVGAGANAFTSATIAGANTAVGAGANAYMIATVAGANVISIAAFAKANTANYRIALELESYGGGIGGVIDNTAALNAAVAAMSGLGIYTIRLRAGTYRFASKPNNFTVPVIIVGESYSTSVLMRDYSESGGNDVGFLTWYGSGATGGGLFAVQVYAATGTTGGTMLRFATDTDDVAGFQRVEDVVVTYGGTGSYYRCLLVDGSLNTTGGSQGQRDFTTRNVYLFKPSAGTESARFLNATNLNFHGWANGNLTVYGGGTSTTNTTYARLDVICIAAVFVGNSSYVAVTGVTNTLNFSTGSVQCSFHGTVLTMTGGTADTGTDNIISTYQDWQTYTPTVTAGTGTITTASATGRYKVVGNLVFLHLAVTITTNGTGATDVQATLPIGTPNITNLIHTMSGRENTSTGYLLQGTIQANTSTVKIKFYDNTYPGADGRTLVLSGFYEIA